MKKVGVISGLVLPCLIFADVYLNDSKCIVKATEITVSVCQQLAEWYGNKITENMKIK